MSAVPREAQARLERLRDLVLAENMAQNLISPASAADIDRRHVADSVQLLGYLPPGVLVDIGTGAGFPGLALACCRSDPVHLVEPRGRRAGFLAHAVQDLGLGDIARVWPCKVQQVRVADVAAITARAVAPLAEIFSAAHHLATRETRWVLPKGRTAQSELDTARLSWQGRIDLVPSATDPASWIVVATNVRRRS